MSLIARVNFKDGKIVDDFGNNWVYHDTNSSNTTAVSGPFDNTSGFHIEPYHFPICSKLNNAKDSKFCSIDFWVKTYALSDYRQEIMYTLDIKDTSGGSDQIFLVWRDGNIFATNYSSSNAIAKLPSEDMLNKWVHIKVCIDTHNSICESEINGVKTITPGLTSLSKNTFRFSSYANYIGTSSYARYYGSETAKADYYDFKLYDSDIIGWNYDSKGSCIIY